MKLIYNREVWHIQSTYVLTSVYVGDLKKTFKIAGLKIGSLFVNFIQAILYLACEICQSLVWNMSAKIYKK